jgi:hypothetical protein
MAGVNGVIDLICRICGDRVDTLDRATVLQRHLITYSRCASCGFVQTETPYWLEEAYSSAIAKADTGVLSRNLQNMRVTSSIISLLFPRSKLFLDYGGGHGIFVRLMRDSGFDFHWYDLHASNDYARGFEHGDGTTYDLLTAFEVLEHLVDPIEELSKMMSCSPNLLVSTELVSSPAPMVSEWWYYCPVTGQHVSFYSLASLRLIAKKFGRHLLSQGPYHLFSKEPQNRFWFRLAMSMRVSKVVNRVWRRPSLTMPDFYSLSK